MGNIEAKKRENLSYNAKIMVDTIDNFLDEGKFPITVYDTDASISEIEEAMKFVIDTGWFGTFTLFARKIRCAFGKGNITNSILFTTNEDDFTYSEEGGYLTILREYPTVTGIVKKDLDNSQRPNENNGDVYIKLDDGSLISHEEWVKKSPQRTIN